MTAKRLRIPRLEPSGTRAYLRAFDKPRDYQPYAGDDAKRLQGEPWRAQGYGRQYRKARQQVIERQHGRCAMCGAQVARYDGSKWTGGEVHHKKALRDGGTHAPGNLVLLCSACHHRQDAERRARERSQGQE